MCPSRGFRCSSQTSWRGPDIKRTVVLLGLLVWPGCPAVIPLITVPRQEQAAGGISRTGPVTSTELTALRDEARRIFQFAFNNYMQHAFPKDELRPMTCGGHDSQGGIALTLIDALDSLIIFNEEQALRDAVKWLDKNLDLNIDARVHVFELTIRALGGLLSAHMLLTKQPSLVPGYRGALLRLAIDLGDRLLPAFQTPSGIPLSWVNLARVLATAFYKY